MSNYTITTDFGAKDSLPSSNDSKVVRGSEFTTEFTSIQTAIATKADTAGDTFTGVVNFSADVAVNTNTLFVDVSEAKVGIGTSSPRTKLHVTGLTGDDDPALGTSSAPLLVSNTANTYGLNVGVNNAGDAWLQAQSNVSSTAYNLLLSPLGGNVGIGTTSPARALHVSSGATNEVARFESTDTACLVEFKDTTGTASIETRNDFRFTAGGSERMRIDASGNVGIGETDPDTELHISAAFPKILMQDTDGTNQYGEFYHSNGTTAISARDNTTNGSISFQRYDGTTATTSMRIDTSGKVGIGTTSPANTLTVGDLTASSNDQDATVGIKCNANHRGIILQENDGAEQWEIGVGEAGALKFYDSGSATPAVTFQDGTGNVGIGTASPDESLVVKGGTYAANQNGGMAVQMGDTSGSHWQSSFKIKSDGSGNVRTTLDASTGAIGGQSQEVISINTAGNVGIGTTSPIRALDVRGGTADVVANFESSDTGGYISLQDNTTSSDTAVLVGAIGDDLRIDTGDTESLRIDSSGNVGIGTSNPSSLLHLASASAPTLTINDTDSTLALELSQDGADGSMVLKSAGTLSIGVTNNSVSDTLSFQTQSTERMRIDSSGNLLVGTTETDIGYTDSGAGVSAHPDGFIQSARSSVNANLYLNKLDNDGEIINFRKDGTAVGSIGTAGGTLDIGSGDATLRFNSGLDAIYPVASVGGGGRDAAVDIGVSSQRFKDLYLSGGVHLGGTTSANKLDDYEEGTFSASSFVGWHTNPTAFSGHYTKVGNLVTITAEITNGSFNHQCYIVGLPFSQVQEGTGVLVSGGINQVGIAMAATTNRIWFGTTDNQSSAGVRFSLSYITS